MTEILNYPLDGSKILGKKNKLKKELSKSKIKVTKKIAILSGATIGYIKDILDVFLLNYGIKCEFFEGSYGQFYEDALFNKELMDFKPDYIYIHTTNKNIINMVSYNDSTEEIEMKLKTECDKFKNIWDKLLLNNTVIIQNNFEMPQNRVLGNLDVYNKRGSIYFINKLNMFMYNYAQNNSNLIINDINYLSAYYGLDKWHNKQQWYAYKHAFDLNAIPLVCHSIANIIKSTLGFSKKVIVTDLDNTMWGGIIGDDGVENLEISIETPNGMAHVEYQSYLKQLSEIGILICICSKNDYNIAKSAFNEIDMPLKFENFVIFKANWNNKASNIIEIANELNLSTDSFIFIDDNPAERDIVKNNIDGIHVVDTSNVEEFIDFIDKSGYFETVNITEEDLKRNKFYKNNIKRLEKTNDFISYDDYLDSLEMIYTFDEFSKKNISRVTQLINKTNQFNLTTKRMTESEVRNVIDDRHINITVSLRDKYGDNGLISVLSSTIYENALNIDIWLMSCRVFNRKVEYKLFDYLLGKCKANNISKIHGKYIPTKKNAFVKDFYKSLGFIEIDSYIWFYNIE